LADRADLEDAVADQADASAVAGTAERLRGAKTANGEDRVGNQPVLVRAFEDGLIAPFRAYGDSPIVDRRRRGISARAIVGRRHHIWNQQGGNQASNRGAP